MSASEWLLFLCVGLFLCCVVGGIVKFIQAIAVLRRGRPPVDESLEMTEEDFKNDE